MYFFAGSEVCLKVIPAFAVISSSCGTGCPLHLEDFAPGGGGGGVGWPSCPLARLAPNNISRSAFACRRHRCVLFNVFPFESGSRTLEWRHRGAVSLLGLQLFIKLKFAIGVRGARLLAVSGLQLIMHVVRLRAEPRGRLEALNRFLQLSPIQQDLPHLILRIGVIRMGRHDLLEKRRSLVNS